MTNPTGDEFSDYNPLTNAGHPPTDEPPTPIAEHLAEFSGGNAEAWNPKNAADKVAKARQRTEHFVRENPFPIIVGALVAGLAIGWALRHATREEEEFEVKTPLGRLNWNLISLPFLWPFLKSLKEKAGDSAETLKDAARDGVDRVRNIDIDRYSKPLRKRWKAWTN